MKPLRWSALVCLGLWVAIGTAGAQADDVEARSREAFLVGVAAYRRGDYDGAVTAWTRSYELRADPLVQFNLAQAYERQGDLPRALSAFERFLADTKPTDPSHPEANARVAALRQRISLTGLTLRGGREGGRIVIDGADMGRTPRPDRIPLAPGPHHVVVEWPVRGAFEAHVMLSVGQVLEVDLPDMPRPVTTVAAPPAPVMRRAAPLAHEPPTSRLWLVAASGMAVTAAALAVLGWGVERQRALRDCGGNTYCGADGEDATRRQRTLALSAGAALAGAGAGLMTFGLVRRERPRARASGCGLGALAFHCRLSF